MLKKVKEILSFSERRKQDVLSLRTVVDKFRELLDCNNQFLELIADMGEKLSGDYLFDKQYIHTTCQSLDEVVYKVVYNLNFIAHKRYLKLFDIYEVIRAGMKEELASKAVGSDRSYLIPLDDITNDMVNLVGGKLAALGELKNRLAMRVPEGFVFSTAAYKRFMEFNRIDKEVKRLSEEAYPPNQKYLQEICNSIISSIIEGKMPPDLHKELTLHCSIIKKRSKEEPRFAVRSSAIDEDGTRSFAGQYETVLNVPLSDLSLAYKKVVASLFSPEAINYRQKQGKVSHDMAMAVGCMVMVPAVASGVIYTLDPSAPEKDVVVISACWGLGKLVVEGERSVDQFELTKKAPYQVIARKIPHKEELYATSSEGGVVLSKVLKEKQASPSISDDDLARLAQKAIEIEKYTKCIQDIEWCIDGQKEIFIMQARPLHAVFSKRRKLIAGLAQALENHRVLMKDKGTVACRGIGAGEVFVVSPDTDFDTVPQGSVLVLRHTSPRMSKLLSKVSAVVTDVGATTGHFATVAREFRVPTIVDTTQASQTLQTGMVVTVDAEENIIYEGIVEELLKFQLFEEPFHEDAPEFRLLRRILKKVAPLNLTDPQDKDFSPSRCETYHDIVRFAHEMVIREISEGIVFDRRTKSYPTKKLRLSIPLDLILVDIGDGLLPVVREDAVAPEAVLCSPLRILIEALTAPGVWQSEPVDMDMDGFMSSFTRPMPLAVPGSVKVEQNVAIISKDYLNLSLKLGYHFNMVDCYLSDNRNDNYIYFRFLGGVTEITRRSRRAKLITSILERSDFVVESKGDLVIARTKKMHRDDMEQRLAMIGRLIGFTRQLDVLLRADNCIEKYVNRFFEENNALGVS